jgi:hypothetical protein
LEPLFNELKLRFDHLTEPCLNSLASRLSQRLVDNLQAFKTIPQQYRMTNRSVAVLEPSQFLENTLRPLTSLNEQKMFAQMSEQVRHKIYESVLTNAIKELKNIIEPIIIEERKMHESLGKYRKGDNIGNNLSDFDKMMMQY